MNTDWFEEKFQFDFEANAIWSNYFETQDTINDQLNRLYCHILNVHHIWIRRIQHKAIESNVWDVFEPRYFARLNHQNFQETLDYLAGSSTEELIRYTDSTGKQHEKLTSNILYHILHHSAHHRGQVALLAQQLNMHDRPSLNYISWR